jgi:superfamily II DNA/RNA helicase
MKAFEKMRLMKLNLVISTDLLARGVDLPEVRLVVNFDMPLTQAEFLHRIGRSGRFGAEGMALSFL